MKKLEIFGDSVMKGVMYVAPKYSLFKSTLTERMEKKGVISVKNCKMGITIPKAAEMIERICPDGERLDGTTVLLEFGGNDSAYDWKKVSEDPLAYHEPVTPQNEFLKIYKSIIERLQTLGANVCVSTLVPIDADKYMNFISRGLSYENIMKFLGDKSMLYRWHEMYNSLVTELARGMGLRIVDLRTAFLMAHNFDELICEDGIHPTTAGHKLIEDKLVEEFC